MVNTIQKKMWQLLSIIFQTPYKFQHFNGLVILYGQLHVYFIEQGSPGETSEHEKREKDYPSHLLCTGKVHEFFKVIFSPSLWGEHLSILYVY